MKSIKKKRSMASHRKLHFQKVLGSMIVALALLFAGSAGAQETKTIKGMVRDVTGEPLIGASVIEKGTNNGVITDVDGNFTLTVPADATLSIAYMGYATREIHLAKRKKQGDLRVTLREDSQQLKEVVVTAMGIKKDTKRLGYAVSTIESDEIVKAGATNFASAMYGKAPGIRITQTQGGSAGAVSINVRGLTSITGNNQPLIILDGVPIRNGGTGKSTDFAEFGNDGQIRSNGLVDINPEDIESVSVLKGASATALYGSEAANGAVVITSKRAKSGKLTVDFTAQVTANLPAYLPKVQTVYGPGRYNTEYSDYEKQTGGFYQRTMNGESYRSLYNTTMSFGPKYDGSDVLYWDGKMRPYLPATDNPWKELFRTGWNQTYNLAISQGTETSSNRFSYTFMGETPNSLTGSFTKHNFKLTGSYKPARTLNIEYSLNYIVQDVKDRPQTSLNLYGSFSNMFSSFMDIPYLKQSYVTSLGYRNTYAGGDATLTPDEAWAYDPGYLNGVSNMLWNMYHHHSKETENRLIGMIRPTWQITNWLSLRAQLSTDITDTKQTLEYETERPNSLYDPQRQFPEHQPTLRHRVRRCDAELQLQHPPFRHCRHTGLDGTLRKHEQHARLHQRRSGYGKLVRPQRQPLHRQQHAATYGTAENGVHGYAEPGLGQLPVPRTHRASGTFVHTEGPKFLLPLRQPQFPVLERLPHACMVESRQTPPLLRRRR